MAGTSKANLRQTASNVAATLVSSFAAIPLFNDKDEALALFKEIRDEVFTDLEKQPTATGGGNYSKGGKSQGDPGKVVVNYGKFKGETLEKIYSLDKEAAAAYDYDKDGKAYISWLTRNDNNKFLKDKATAFIESKRAAASTVSTDGDGVTQPEDAKGDGEDW